MPASSVHRVSSNSCPLNQWCHPTISSSVLLLPSVFASIRVFSHESALHNRWPKYWSFSFIISPSNVYSGLISFRIDWLDLLAVQGTLKSLLQHHIQKHQLSSSQPSLWSNSHIHTWLLEKPKLWLFRPLSAKSYLCFLIYCLGLLLVSFQGKEQASFNFMAAVTIHTDFGAQESEIWHCSHIVPIYLPWSDRARCHDLSFLTAEF